MKNLLVRTVRRQTRIVAAAAAVQLQAAAVQHQSVHQVQIAIKVQITYSLCLLSQI